MGKHIFSGHIYDNIGNHNNDDVDCDDSESYDMARRHEKYPLYCEMKERVIMTIIITIMMIILNSFYNSVRVL